MLNHSSLPTARALVLNDLHENGGGAFAHEYFPTEDAEIDASSEIIFNWHTTKESVLASRVLSPGQRWRSPGTRIRRQYD